MRSTEGVTQAQLAGGSRQQAVARLLAAHCRPQAQAGESLRFADRVQAIGLALFAFLILAWVVMLERWRLIVDAPCDGATNMARDSALAAVHARGTTPPTLRLYAWRPACVSLGRFQRSDALDRAACVSAGVAVVRRPSGGRALLHDAELTYAVIIGERHAQLGGESILASYRAISLALLAGLRRLGVAAELTPANQPAGSSAQYAASPNTSRPAHSAACFDSPASYELTVGGRKLVGSAQTRRGGVILQHGAIPLAPHTDRLRALLHGLPDDLDARMIALDQAAGRAIGFDELALALVAGFGEVWGAEFERGQPTGEELVAERALRAEQYANESWTFRR